MFSMQLCIPTCRSGSSLAAQCLFAWRSYGCICGAIFAEPRAVNGDGNPIRSGGTSLVKFDREPIENTARRV